MYTHIQVMGEVTGATTTTYDCWDAPPSNPVATTSLGSGRSGSNLLLLRRRKLQRSVG